MGGLLFGWDWVVIGGAKPFFQRYFALTSETQIGWANSCALIGCLAGALAAGALSDKLGRKRLLIVSALLFAVTSLGNALAHNFSIFIACRIESFTDVHRRNCAGPNSWKTRRHQPAYRRRRDFAGSIHQLVSGSQSPARRN
jgi:hypothetical protein